MAYNAGRLQTGAMRLRASLGGAGLHIPLQYIPPVEESTAAQEAHADIDTPTQEQDIAAPAHGGGGGGQWNHEYVVDTPLEESPPRFHKQLSPDPPSPPARVSSKTLSTYSKHSAAESDSSDCSVQDANGYKILLGKERWGLTLEPFVTENDFENGRPRSRRIKYIEGVRGLMAIQTLLWLFFRAFAPAIVTDTDVDGTQPAVFVTNAPGWMNTFRKVLTPVLFDGSIQMTMYIILLGRTGLLSYIERREAIHLAGECFRRPIRIVIPVALTIALISVLTATNSFRFAPSMAANLSNEAVQPPAKFDNALEYFNSLLSLMFEPYAQRDTRAVGFLPLGRIAWFIDVAFQQTYVLTIFAFVLPFTIFKYKVWGFGMMILLSAWVDRWSWYTVTGLVLAEFAVVYRPMMPDRASSATTRKGERRVSLTPSRKSRLGDIFMWLTPALMMFVGLLFRYTWTSIAPQYANKELLAHGDITTAELADPDAVARAYPRYDTWLFCTGFLMMLELSDPMQRIFANRVFVYLGRLGFSLVLLSGTIMISLGAMLHAHLVESKGWTDPSRIIFVEFLAMIPVCLLAADIWSRLVDDSSLYLSRAFFRFARD